jgi:hypothetical protein
MQNRHLRGRAEPDEIEVVVGRELRSRKPAGGPRAVA